MSILPGKIFLLTSVKWGDNLMAMGSMPHSSGPESTSSEGFSSPNYSKLPPGLSERVLDIIRAQPLNQLREDEKTHPATP